MSDLKIEPFDVSTLDREPEFFLEILLTALRDTPDGHSTRRVYSDLTNRWVWELDAGGYVIDVKPDFECGFDEEGDGKVLTAILQRTPRFDSQVVLKSELVPREYNGMKYREVRWNAKVKLGKTCPYTLEEYRHAGHCGYGLSRHPGTAALLAYLRAWGMVSHNLGLGER